jgi:hypothetical protein
MEIEVYGAETSGPEDVGYAIVALSGAHRMNIKHRLQTTKAKHGGKDNADIRCAQLFNDAGRAKSGWAHLDQNGTLDLVADVCEDIASAGGQSIVAIADRAPWQGSVSDGWKRVGASTGLDAASYADRHLALVCAAGALSNLRPSFADEKIVFRPDPDGDLTIPWKGAWIDDLLGRIWNDFGGEAGRFSIQPVGVPAPPLLQLADVLAYVSRRARAADASPATVRFRAMIGRLQPAIFKLRQKG